MLGGALLIFSLSRGRLVTVQASSGRLVVAAGGSRDHRRALAVGYLLFVAALNLPFDPFAGSLSWAM